MEDVKFKQLVEKISQTTEKKQLMVKTSVQSAFYRPSHVKGLSHLKGLGHLHHWLMAPSTASQITCQSGSASSRPHLILAYDTFSPACDP